VISDVSIVKKIFCFEEKTLDFASQVFYLCRPYLSERKSITHGIQC
jgi:hypothetical protein